MSFLNKLFGGKNNEEHTVTTIQKINEGCIKCGCCNFEHDSYFDEYVCSDCGWASSEKPNGNVNITCRKSKSDMHIVVMTTSFPSQGEAEEVLATSTDSEARLDAATALGKTNSLQVVPSLAKALMSDPDK